jgi:hypothetical protein
MAKKKQSEPIQTAYRAPVSVPNQPTVGGPGSLPPSPYGQVRAMPTTPLALNYNQAQYNAPPPVVTKKGKVKQTIAQALGPAPVAAANPTALQDPNASQLSNLGVVTDQRQTQQNGRVNVANYKGTQRDQTAQLHAQTLAYKQAKKSGDQNAIASALSDIQSTQQQLQQTKSDKVLSQQQTRLAGKRGNFMGQFTAEAGTRYGRGEQGLLIQPTDIVHGTETQRPGEIANALASTGDTVTQGHMQTIARPGGATPSDFVANSNFTPGSNAFGLGNAPVNSSVGVQASYTNIGQKGFSPGEIVNMQREVDNMKSRDAAVRQQQAIDTLNSGQSNVRNLYGQADAESQRIGDQAYGRINEAEKERQASNESGLISRGLSNSTVLSTTGSRIARDAEDNRQGVDEQRAARAMGLRTDLAGTEYANAGNIAQAINGQQYQDQSAQTAGSYGYVKQKKNPYGAIGAGAGAIIGGLFTGGAGAGLGASIGGAVGNAAGG